MKKKMIIIALSVVIAFIGIILAIIFVPSRTNMVEADKFETAFQTCEKISAGWNIGNSLDSNGEWIGLYTQAKPEDYETAWGNVATTPELIATVKAAGFNAVRIPITWYEHIDKEGNINSEWIQRVQEVVDYVIRQDMYCVINVHHDSGGGWLKATPECYAQNSEKFAKLWTNIAIHFKDYDEKLIFEGFNEMLDSQGRWGGAGSPEEYKAHNDFNQLFVNTVRATGGNNAQRNLMVQIYSGICGDGSLDNFILPTDTTEEHLIIQVHNYDPQPFTWTSVDYTEPTNQWGTSDEKQQIVKLFKKLADFSALHNTPVIIGECGADYKNNEDARKNYVKHFFDCASQYNIRCIWWDTGAMSLFDRENCTVLYPDIIKLIVERH